MCHDMILYVWVGALFDLWLTHIGNNFLNNIYHHMIIFNTHYFMMYCDIHHAKRNQTTELCSQWAELKGAQFCTIHTSFRIWFQVKRKDTVRVRDIEVTSEIHITCIQSDSICWHWNYCTYNGFRSIRMKKDAWFMRVRRI